MMTGVICNFLFYLAHPQMLLLSGNANNELVLRELSIHCFREFWDFLWMIHSFISWEHDFDSAEYRPVGILNETEGQASETLWLSC